MMLQNWTQACDPKKLMDLAVPCSLSNGGLVPFLETVLDLMNAEKFMTLQETSNNQYMVFQPTSYIVAFNIFGFLDVDDSWLFFKPDREPIAYPDYIQNSSSSNQFYMHDHLSKRSASPLSLNELIFEHYYAYHRVLSYQQMLHEKKDSLSNWDQHLRNTTKNDLLEDVDLIDTILFDLAKMVETYTKQWKQFSKIPRNSRGIFIPFKFIAIPKTLPKKYNNRSNLLQTSYLTYESIIHQRTETFLSTHLKVSQTAPNSIMILTSETSGTCYTLNEVQMIGQVLESQQKKLAVLQGELIELGLQSGQR